MLFIFFQKRSSRLSFSFVDLGFSNIRRKSSSTFSSSSSSATLSISTRCSQSDYSFNNTENSNDGSSSCNSFATSDCFQTQRSLTLPSSLGRKKSLKKCLSVFDSSPSSRQHRLHQRSSSMFSNCKRRSRNSLSLSEQSSEKCVLL